MMIFTAKLTRKKAAIGVIAAGVALLSLLFFLGRGPAPEETIQPQLLSNDDRVAYLQSLGWEVDPEPLETLQFLLPEPLGGTYVAYNELQLAQGFDLNSCCGKQVTRYTYRVLNYPEKSDTMQANLYLCENLPVAGDILCPGAEGFQVGLAYPAAEE